MSTSRRIFARLRTEPRALLGYYARDAMRAAVVVGVLAALRSRWPAAPLEAWPWAPLALLAAIPTGWRIASILHNTGHSNYRSWLDRWTREGFVNDALGELVGAWVGYGFTSFVLIHSLHHAYSDRELDPVCPRGLGFFQFMSGPLRYPIRKGRRFLDELHGRSAGYARVRLGEAVLLVLGIALRIAAFWLAFGPNGFAFFYVPSVLSNIAILAHINFVCHRDRDDGSVEVVNLDHTLYYRVANFVTTGGYFHKSHHLRPTVFDPRTVELASVHDEHCSLGPGEGPPRVLRRAGRKGLVGRLRRYFDVDDVWGNA